MGCWLLLAWQWTPVEPLMFLSLLRMGSVGFNVPYTTAHTEVVSQPHGPSTLHVLLLLKAPVNRCPLRCAVLTAVFY